MADPTAEAEEGTPGGVALVLVGVLISTLQAKGLVSSHELEIALRLLLGRELTPAQREEVEDAIAILEGMTARVQAGRQP